MIFTPSEPLSLATSYTVSIAPGVEDLAGNPMTDLPPPFDLLHDRPARGGGDRAGRWIAPTSRSRPDRRCASPRSWTPRRWRRRSACGPPSPTSFAGAGCCSRSCRPSPCSRDRSRVRDTVGEGAFDVSGVALEAPANLSFTTLVVRARPLAAGAVRRDRWDRPTSPIAVFFDRADRSRLAVRTMSSYDHARPSPARSTSSTSWARSPPMPSDGRRAALHAIGSAAGEHDLRGRARRRAITGRAAAGWRSR